MTDRLTKDPPQDQPCDDEELVPADDTIIGVAFKWSLVVIVLLGIAAATVAFVLRPSP